MKLAIQICSEREWRSTKSILKIGRNQLQKQPYGKYFNYRVGDHRSIIYWSGAMITHYLKIAMRNLKKQKVYSFINIG